MYPMILNMKWKNPAILLLFDLTSNHNIIGPIVSPVKNPTNQGITFNKIIQARNFTTAINNSVDMPLLPPFFLLF